jgi:hypothetical protein
VQNIFHARNFFTREETVTISDNGEFPGEALEREGFGWSQNYFPGGSSLDETSLKFFWTVIRLDDSACQKPAMIIFAHIGRKLTGTVWWNAPFSL